MKKHNYFDLPVILDFIKTSLFEVGITHTDEVLHNLNIALLTCNEERGASLTDPAHNLSSVPSLYSLYSTPQ